MNPAKKKIPVVSRHRYIRRAEVAYSVLSFINRLRRLAVMVEWLCCLACTIKVRCSNRGATRYRMTLNNSGMTVCLGSPNDAHWLSGGTLRQVGLLSRATASNSCRKNIGLSKLSPDSTLYRKAFFSKTMEAKIIHIELSYKHVLKIKHFSCHFSNNHIKFE
jgi:hypothetical protein